MGVPLKKVALGTPRTSQPCTGIIWLGFYRGKFEKPVSEPRLENCEGTDYSELSQDF